MELLVIGAGASVEEGRRVGLNPEQRPPLDFTEKMWALDERSYAPNHLLSLYLMQSGYAPGGNPLKTFIDVEKRGDDRINVERFFAWVWQNRQVLDDGVWNNLVYHGICNPLVFLLVHFYANGVGWKPLSTAQLVARNLQSGDLLVNLNYDTLFELGAEQAGVQFSYVPNAKKRREFWVAKPHGSLNLIVRTDGSAAFGQPDFMHMVVQQGETMEHLRGIVPPRFDKQYDQHPIAKVILDAIAGETPRVITFWGVGLTDSDVDLLRLYRSWAAHAEKVVMINPNPQSEAPSRAAKLLGKQVEHLLDIEAWADREYRQVRNT